MQPKCLLNPIYNVGVENPMSPRDSVCGGVIRPIFPPRSILYMSSFKSKGPRNINVQAMGGFCKNGHFSCGVFFLILTRWCLPLVIRVPIIAGLECQGHTRPTRCQVVYWGRKDREKTEKKHYFYNCGWSRYLYHGSSDKKYTSWHQKWLVGWSFKDLVNL